MAISGFQFGHIGGYAVEPSARAKEQRTAAAIIAEMYRVDGTAPHVAKPQPPIVLEGPQTAAAMERAFLDELTARKKALRAVRGAGGSSSRIRKDQQALEACVYSLPVLAADYVAGDRPDANADQLAAKVEGDRAIDLHIKWIHADADRRGLDVQAIVMHTDEKFVHIHAHSFPRNERMSAKECQPGHVAKENFKAAWVAENGPKLTDDAKARMNAAYNDAMRNWQDAYWRECASLCGLTRKGPGRQRLTRQEWLASKAAAANIAAISTNLENQRKAVSEQRDELTADRRTVESDQIALAGRETALEAEMRKAKLGQQVAAAALQARSKIDDGEIVPDQVVGLVLAPHAKTEENEAWWTAAQKRLRPLTKIWQRLVEQALRLAELHKERAALKKELAKLDQLIGDAGRDISEATALRIAKQQREQRQR